MADQEHKHGSMDIKVQQEMFGKFISMVGWGAGLSLVALVLLYLING